jgi:hypothetical protein
LEHGHDALSEESHVELGLLVRHATEGQFGHQVVKPGQALQLGELL